MLKQLRFSIRQAVYEYRAKQWNLIIVALIFAVMMLSCVQFIADKVQSGLEKQSAKLLGGDLVIESTVPIDKKFQEYANKLELSSANVIILQTMINRAGKFTLVNLQAVSPSYPLIGKALIIPAKQALVNQRIITDYSLTLPAQLKIGAAYFTVNSLIPNDIDLGYSGWLLAPRVIINMVDLPATSTLIPGSRATYRLLLTGSSEKLKNYFQLIKPLLKPQQRILTPTQNRYRLLNNLNAIIQFIQLAVIVGIILCGVAITLSVRQYVIRHHKQIALWRSLGASANQVRLHYLLQLFFAALISFLVGISLGYCLQLSLLKFITPYFNYIDNTISFKPLLLSGTASFVILFCYAYPSIQTLSSVSALQLWREAEPSSNIDSRLGIASFFVFALFVLFLMHFSLFTFFILDCLAFGIGLFMLVCIVLFSFLNRLSNYFSGASYRGIKQILQYPQTSSTQISALSLVLTCLFMLIFFKADLLNQWQTTLKQDAPNYFAFNLSSDEIPEINRYFRENKLPEPIYYPMIKGRIVSLNGVPIFSVPNIDKSHNSLHRDLNLSASEVFPSDNQIIQGNPWTSADNSKLLISVESTVANALHLKLGDKLTFLIYDNEITATVSNIRTVDWQSMHPNFYVIFTPHSLPKLPSTYITSFYLSPINTPIIANILNSFPNVTVIDISELLKQLQDWLTRAASALQFIFLFSLIAALMVVGASLLTTIEERNQSYRLIRILGGTRSYILKSMLVEASIICLIAFSLSYLTASALFYALLTVL